MKDISLKKAAVILAAAVIAVLAIIGISRNNSGGGRSEENAAKTESVSPAANEAEPAVSDPATASVPGDKTESEDTEETGIAEEEDDQPLSASGEENKGNKGNSSRNSAETADEGKETAAQESDGTDSGAIASESGGMPILGLDAVKAEAGSAVQTPDTSGDEQQNEDNETTMMTNF